ncbi:MAG: MerR family transcriptional regulator [Flavobacterium sp.]|jgi:DNA-binding transcriptional MerR regulator
MNYIKQSFSISDLENISGIKSHTIRIWEKRYQIFSPIRNISSNARTYEMDDLKKVLNIVYLSKIGYKISKIANLNEFEIQSIILNDLENDQNSTLIINQLKISMLEFDKSLFNNIYSKLLDNLSFKEIYTLYFMPLLVEIGYLWQTNVINSTHEHFISYLIIQKINLETCKIEDNFNSETLYVLFLPENELHEIALLFCNYYLNLNQKNTLYLGQTIITEEIFILTQKFKKICFVSNITHPFGNEFIENYIKNFYELNIKNTENELVISNSNFENNSNFATKVHRFSNVKNMLDYLI